MRPFRGLLNDIDGPVWAQHTHVRGSEHSGSECVDSWPDHVAHDVIIVRKARENIAVATYKRAIQTGFQEVSDALAGRRYLAEQMAAQERGA